MIKDGAPKWIIALLFVQAGLGLSGLVVLILIALGA